MTVRLAMTFKEIDLDQTEAVFTDPDIAIEQKVDGTRALCVIETRGDVTSIRFLARSGAVLKHSAATQHLDRIKWALLDGLPLADGEIVLDGEVMIDTGEYVLFDLPYFKGDGSEYVVPEMPYRERRAALATLAANLDRPIRLGESARTTEAKVALFEAVRDSGGEGVMAKSLRAPYEPGKRVKHSVKIKFVKTADVVVTDSSRGRNDAGRETGAFAFGAYDESGAFVALGSCSAIGKAEVQIGDVIEVAYLYRPESGGLVQPRMLKVRDDREPESCTLEQFPTYSKAVL